jgi:hypothetical protein
MKPPAGLWHWSPHDPGPKRLDGLDDLCQRARDLETDQNKRLDFVI